MKKLSNPYAKQKEHNCFACEPRNEYGLKMEFWEDGDSIYSFWKPRQNFEGFPNVIHGGILATMMDEIACRFIFIKKKTSGVTIRLNIKYLKPVLLDDGEITLKASFKEEKRNISTIQVELFNGKKVLCTKGIVSCYLYPEKIAREKLNFPGVDAFYQD